MDVPITELRARLADLVNRVSYTGEPVGLTRRGRVMAGIVSAEDLELVRRIRAGLINLTDIGPAQAEPGQPAARVDPLRIAAEYRPGGPPLPPGFSR